MNTVMTHDPPNSPPLPDASEIRTFLTHLDSTFHARVNIFLVAQSLLLAALCQVWGTKELSIIMVLCLVALFASLLLWQPLRDLGERTAEVAKLLGDDAIYQKYLMSGQTPLAQTRRLASLVPLLFVTAWLAITGLALTREFGICMVFYTASGKA